MSMYDDDIQNATWRKEIQHECKINRCEFPHTFAPEGLDLDKTFHSGYGGTNGEPFLAWSDDRVFFPVKYDGAEWVCSVPRNPVAQGQEHVGGG